MQSECALVCVCVFVLVSCHCHRSAYVCCLLSVAGLSLAERCLFASSLSTDSFHIAADVMLLLLLLLLLPPMLMLLLLLLLLLLLVLFPCLASSLHCQWLNCHKPGIGRINIQENTHARVLRVCLAKLKVTKLLRCL